MSSAVPAADDKRRRLVKAYLERRGDRAGTADPIPHRPAGAPAPLSWAQRQVWLHAQVAPDVPVYNEPITVRRRGPLDVDALERALSEIVARHEIWRTVFAVEDGEPVQRIAPPWRWSVPVVDLRGLPAGVREAEALHLARLDAVRPFDLARGPLVRALLVHVDDDDHRLFLTLHHIVHDGVSVFGLLIPELTALYGAFVAGERLPLVELPIQYGDFARWERSVLDGEALQPHLDYWQGRLGGDRPATELTSDRPRPARQSFRGARQAFALPPALGDGLKVLSAQERVTLFMTLFAAFAAVVHRYTGLDDLTLGTVSAGRKRPEIQRLLGFFANPLALRVVTAGDPTVRELLHRVRDSALDALAHDEAPIEQVVNALKLPRDPRRNPLFQLVFALEAPRSALPAGWELSHLDVDPGTSKFDLYLELADHGPHMVGRCVYQTDLFDAPTIGRFVQHYRRTLEAFVADPEQRLSALPLVDEVERARLLEWGTRRGSYPEMPIHRIFEAHVARRPDAVALVADDRRLTYAELDRYANHLAQRLRTLGARPGVRVGVLMERSLEMVVALLGVLKSGAAYVPLGAAYPRDLLAFMLEDADVAAVVTVERLRMALPDTAPTTIVLDADGTLAGPAPTTIVDVGPDDVAYVMYTSGSTGRPKGVAVPHRGIVRLLFGQDYTRFAPDEVFGHVSAFTFDVTTFEIWGALLHGARCVMLPPGVPTPAVVADTIGRHGITTLWLTGSLFNGLIEDAPGALAGLRRLLVGGEALSVPHVRRALGLLRGTQLINGYGPTEASVFACCHPVPRDLPADAPSVPIGRPITNTDAYVMDRHGQLTPIGVPGELLLGGPGVALGYVNRPDLTREKFIPDPFTGEPGARVYRTGDLVRWRPDGTLEYLGRLDNQVKVRGFRIEPGEVEAAIAQYPEVREVAVAARPDGHGGKRLVAYVVPRAASGPPLTELRPFLGERLAPHMIPSLFVTLTSLPLTPSGKIDRQRLPAPEALTTTPSGEAVEPRDAVEGQLVELWEDLLGVRGIGVTDDFFDLGGHSLLAVRMLQRLAESYRVTLPLATLYTNSTVERLAEALRQGDDHGFRAPMTRLNPEGRQSPLIFFHGDLHGGGLYCVRLGRRLGPDQPLTVVHPLGRAGRPMPRTIEAMADEHLEALQALPRTGAWRLGGYCNGALVAFEIARRLTAAGEKVDLLALIAADADTRMSSLHAVASRVASGSDWFGRLRSFTTMLEGRPLRERISLAWDKATNLTAAPLRRARGKPTRPRRDDVYSRYFRAVMGYVPRYFPGRVVLFWPADEPCRHVDDPTHGWRGFADSVEVFTVPGDHSTIITDHIDAIAAQLANYL